MKKRAKKIDRQTVAQALDFFENHGGIISQLPAQKYRARHMVGEERHNHYEPLHAFSSLA